MSFTQFTGQRMEGDQVTEAKPSPDVGALSEAFIAELKHWREVAGVSQKGLAKLTGYTPSYLSKVERGALVPSRQFTEAADQHLHAGHAILRRWKALHEATRSAVVPSPRRPEQTSEDLLSALSATLVVEHEDACMSYEDGVFRSVIRRQLTNVGDQPVTRYLIRIAVDRYPGDPERSNRLYREHPLTWEEIGLSAACRGEPMTWLVKHDRDAFKELWLLFANDDGLFPLYPGETTWIEYSYTVGADKWGPWWQRAVRLPTRRTIPADLEPAVWGMETSMTAEASPFRTPIVRSVRDGMSVFTWSTDDPPVHARFRMEWKFRSAPKTEGEGTNLSASERMSAIGVVQEGDVILTTPTRPFDLLAEAEDARRVIAQLLSTTERVSQVHTFAKGMGLAAPQIGIGRAAALVRSPEGDSVTLLNPRIIDQSAETDEQYEGCLSFFDVRGLVKRPLRIEVEHQNIDGEVEITAFDLGMARLVAHEIDHLDGILYRSRMPVGAKLIPVADYKGTGQRWTYRAGRTAG
jgi:peptide deformylase